ncbi:hypothetical protein JQC92_06750 [Shewanella sp. 202IG2-18]|uniref:hypothetical protein n=1 Tax=Parashewanella hymeniacidonis TaxID=2807618 RepID=UPI001961B9DE|nr:hypothetical protein [Parashewanella hymeniacidonis]MBM7071741.1 hypothetical protein [Parashewanella hymeniacidonis]
MRWLICLLLYSSIATAAPNLLSVLTQTPFQNPIDTMRNIENSTSGVITHFAIDTNNSPMRYLFTVLDPKKHTVTQLEYCAVDGVLIKRKATTYDSDKHSELAAINFISKNKLLFSELVELAIHKNSVHLLNAELDHDLGISYLELKLIDNNGRYRLAFDVEKLRPLPLLKWY